MTVNIWEIPIKLSLQQLINCSVGDGGAKKTKSTQLMRIFIGIDDQVRSLNCVTHVIMSG